MIDLIERIGPILGIAAFLGFAILAFLIFQQAREVRRLREWAGRAPERAEEAADAAIAAAEAREEAREEASEEPGRVAGPVRSAWNRFDNLSPLDPRYLIAALAAVVIAVGVVSNGFGFLVGDEPQRDPGAGERGGAQQREQARDRPEEVAVLNGTQVLGPEGIMIAGVPGLADEVAEELIRPLDGFRPGERNNAASGFDQTTIMFESGARDVADRLAREVEPVLGETPTEPMIQEVRDLAGGARVAVVVGQDDADF